jgi:hypothetical protein
MYELPVAIKKLIASVEEDTISLIGVTVELLVTLMYCILLVTKVPAPGTESIENNVVTEPVGTLKILLSTKLILLIVLVTEDPTLSPFSVKISNIWEVKVAIPFNYKY